VRRNLYPVDFDALIDQHQLLGMSRTQILESLPRLRGTAPEPRIDERAPQLEIGA